MKKLVELNKIFRCEYGNKFDLNKMTAARAYEGSVAFVGRSGKNNGVTAFVTEIDGVKPYKAGNITVALGGAILSSFVQPRRFYTGQNVAVLTPPADMPLSEKLYYCLCIEKNRHRYGAFGREANRTLRTLLLPDRGEVPAWVSSAYPAVVQEWETALEHTLGE
ncbi:TPA: restriction endonuclease subunit S [Burkholderia vietnamiensis]|nr:restriction endonuclease subunit S [Burkholderia vietnamiensis]